MVRAASAMVRACHPEATVAVTAVVVALSLAAGRGWGAAWAGAAVLAGQLSVGWGNDWLDRDLDRAAGRADKPIPAGALSAETVRRGWLAALGAAALLSLASGLRAALAHLLAIGLAWAYNLRLKSSLLSPLPYAGAFALLPVFVTLGAHGGLPEGWVVLAAACLGSSAHFTQTLPDIERDAALGVRGLPHRLGAGGSLLATAILLVCSALAVALGPATGPPRPVQALLAGAAALVAAVVVAGAAGARRAAFRLTLGTAAALVAALLLAAPQALRDQEHAKPTEQVRASGVIVPAPVGGLQSNRRASRPEKQ